MSTKGHAPAHQNTFTYKHNTNSRLTAKIAAMPNKGLCRKCHDIIEWRKKYRKYKPLTKPHKCNICHLPKVMKAYHHVCPSCADELDMCPKCQDKNDEFGAAEREKDDIRAEIDMLEGVKGHIPGLSERERRSALRELYRKASEVGMKVSRTGGRSRRTKGEGYEEGGEGEDDEGDEEGGSEDEDAEDGVEYTPEEAGDILTKALKAARRKQELMAATPTLVPVATTAGAGAGVSASAAVEADEGDDDEEEGEASLRWKVQERLHDMIVVPKRLPKKADVAASGTADATSSELAEAAAGEVGDDDDDDGDDGSEEEEEDGSEEDAAA